MRKVLVWLGLLLVAGSLAGWVQAPESAPAGDALAGDGPVAPVTAGASGAVPASRQADRVAIITIEGGIDAITEMSVKRRIKQAEDSGANAMVFEIDSPGGEVGAVLEITNAIKSSSIRNTVAWIHPDAYSGGAIIALACREIVTSDPASFGDALPIVMGMGGAQRATEVMPAEKILPPLLTDVADSARRAGYDEYLVQAIVTDGIELWAVRDTETNQWLFINEDEYRMLFEGDPPRGRPVLTSVPKSVSVEEGRSRAVGGGSADDAEGVMEDGEAVDEDLPAAEDAVAGDESAAGGEDERPTNPFGDDFEEADPARAFRAANPELQEIIERARAEQGSAVDPTTASQRPVISESMRGRFVEPVYISDGSGPIVMRNDQMQRFGLSSATINNDEELRAFFGAQTMVRTDQSWSEHLVAFLTNPIVRGILIVAFLLGLFVEMTSPGLVVPGSVALGALVALIAPPALIGMAGWWEIAAIGLGIVLIAVEILVLPGFGVFGILGLIGLFAGLVGTFVPDGTGGLFPDTAAGRSDLLYGVATIVLATFTSGVGIYFISKHFGTLPFIGKLVLSEGVARDAEERVDPELAAARPLPTAGPRVGGVATTVSPLRPSGSIEIDGEVVDAVSESGYIESGAAVTIVARRGFSWVVEPGVPGLAGGDEGAMA